MGDVHLARPFNPKRGIPTPVVIKRLHGELTADEDFIRRFRHEADIAVNIDSPHVAKVFDVGKVGDAFFIAMEFVPGWPLSKFLDAVLQSKRHASVGSVIDLIDGGLRGLHALHSAVDVKTGRPLGIVHRDISPKNLMVGEDGLMRLIDLGLGKSNVQDWKTRTGVVMGSVGYMPPEQVTAERVDHRADIYAMGVVLWETLALRNFLKRGPVPMMLHASLNPEWTPPSKIRPDLPRALDEVIHKAVQLHAADRYGSAAEFLAAIREVLPEKKSTGANSVGALIRELFGAELEDRRLELEALLGMPLPYPDDEGPEPDKTVIFAEAKGIAPLTEEDLSPTSVQFSPSLLPAMSGTPPGMGPPASSLGVMPFAGPTAPMSMVSSINSNLIAPRQGISAPAAVGIAVGALLVGALGMKLMSAPDAVVTPLVTDVATHEIVGARAGTTPRTLAPPEAPRHDPPKEAPRPIERVERPDRTSTAERPAEPAREPPKPKETVAPPIEASAESNRATFQAISKEAQEALSKLPAGDPKRADVAKILTDASLESGSLDYERAATKLGALRTQLRTISP